MAMSNNILESISHGSSSTAQQISVCTYGDMDLSLQKWTNVFPKRLRFFKQPFKGGFVNHCWFLTLKFLEKLKRSPAPIEVGSAVDSEYT